MQTKARLVIAIIVLSLFFKVQLLSYVIEDIENPYKDISVFLSAQMIKSKKKISYEDSFSGNYNILCEGYKGPEALCLFKTLFFQLVIKKGKDEIKLKKHSYDRSDEASFSDKVYKQKFLLNEKNGEVTYKVEFENSKGKKKKAKYDYCRIKILYAELDGKEMRMNDDAWRNVQVGCDAQEAGKQNCLIRSPETGKVIEDENNFIKVKKKKKKLENNL